MWTSSGRLIGFLILCAASGLASAACAQNGSEPTYVDHASQPRSVLEESLGEDSYFNKVAMWLQQPSAQPTAPLGAAPRLTTPTTPTTRPPTRQSNVGLASVPNMFGDCACGTTGNFTIIGNDGTTVTEAKFRIPVAAGSRTGKISENDIALPVDRIFFTYNNFHNVFQMRAQQTFPAPGPLLTRQEPIDRYTMGFEKTFFDQTTSIELRMPFSGSFDANLPGIGVSNGNFGNMAVILKGLLWRGENLGIGGGMSIDTPTGSSVISRAGATNLKISNDAVHLLPYLGFLYSPGDPQWGWGNGLFMTGFLQFDAAANGNRVQFVDPVNGTQTIGKYNEQNVLFVDLAVGYWLYRNPYADRFTGLAVVNEFHYTTSVQDPDLVAGTNGGTGAVITNEGKRFDVMNYSIGVQVLMFDLSSLRVAGVFPLGSAEDRRFFDSEVQVQFNRRF